ATGLMKGLWNDFLHDLIFMTNLQVQDTKLFHDSWNIACFVILLLFVLAVISLVMLAFLYELFNCCCCANDKSINSMENKRHPVRAMMDSMRRHKVEVV
uniref:Small integral membrane protein 18 n=1 Tax=Callorhinchus milii TaxID=7868 RepID=A0A4W3J3Z9_CALMI